MRGLRRGLGGTLRGGGWTGYVGDTVSIFNELPAIYLKIFDGCENL